MKSTFRNTQLPRILTLKRIAEMGLFLFSLRPDIDLMQVFDWTAKKCKNDLLLIDACYYRYIVLAKDKQKMPWEDK